MLHKTKGIVLHYIKYSETSIIVKIYTETFGIQSYIVNGVRSKNNKNKIALFQPLTLLDMVVYHKANATSLNRIAEVRCSEPFQIMCNFIYFRNFIKNIKRRISQSRTV
jgi:DNA repair protein RecO (recombination protein O)